MKNFVKLASFITIATMLFGLVGCGSSPNGIVNAADEASTTQVQQQSQADKVADTASTTSSGSKDLKVSIPDISTKDLMQGLVKAMQEEYKDGNIISTVYPSARAVQSVESGEADFEFPFSINPEIKNEKIIYSSEKVFPAIFVLYTNKSNKEINTQNLYNYKIEVQPTHKEDFNNSMEAPIDAGLQKVDTGRIDGYIAVMTSGDASLKKLNLKNIKRSKYITFDGGFIFPNNERGKAAEKTISGIIAKLKANGKFQEILKVKLEEKFIEDPN